VWRIHRGNQFPETGDGGNNGVRRKNNSSGRMEAGRGGKRNREVIREEE